MTVHSRTCNQIDKLAQHVIETAVNGSAVPQDSRMGRELPVDSGDESNRLFLGEEATQLYFTALDALASDPEFNHLTRKELDLALALLAHDLAVNRTHIDTSYVRRERIEHFFATLTRPPVPYEIVFNIEGIKFAPDPLVVGDVVFREFTSEIAAQWDRANIDDVEAPFRESLRETFAALTGQPVGIVRVSANSAEKAVERAQGVFDRALNTLRLCIGSFPWSVVYDQELLQRRGRFCIVRQLEPATRLVPIDRGHRFWNTELDLVGPLDEWVRYVEEQIKPLYTGAIQGELHQSLLRSIDWLGTSITRENYDHKVLDLCNALETVLTTASDHGKSDSVALRSVLLSMALGGDFVYPRAILRLYDFRPDVIHASALGVCGRSDYRLLWWKTSEVVLDIIKLHSTHRSITQISQLIKLLESRERIEEVINQLERWQDEATKAMIAYAKSRLQEQEEEPV